VLVGFVCLKPKPKNLYGVVDMPASTALSAAYTYSTGETVMMMLCEPIVRPPETAGTKVKSVSRCALTTFTRGTKAPERLSQLTHAEEIRSVCSARLCSTCSSAVTLRAVACFQQQPQTRDLKHCIQQNGSTHMCYMNKNAESNTCILSMSKEPAMRPVGPLITE
jgi:hypothetical protein